MKRIIILLCCIFVGIINCIAQDSYTLRGLVKDTLNNAVENVIVTLTQRDSLVGTCLTDNKGRYSYKRLTPGEYTITLTHNNYTPLIEVKEIARHTHTKHIICPIAQVNLQEVIISSDRSNVVKSNASGEIFYLSEQARKESNIYNALIEIPSLVSDPISRKLTAADGSSILLLINGVQSRGNFETIDPSNIESIELIENPSVKYLKNGFTKVLNLKIRREKQNYQILNATTTQQIKLRKGTLYGGFETGNEKYALYINANWNYQKNLYNDYNTEYSGTIFRNISKEYNQKSSNFGVEIGGDLLPNKKNYLSYFLYAQHINDTKQINGNGIITYNQEEPKSYQIKQYDRYVPRTYGGTINHRWTSNSKITIEQLLNYRHTLSHPVSWNQEEGINRHYMNENENKLTQISGKYQIDLNGTPNQTTSWTIGSQLSFMSNNIKYPLLKVSQFDYQHWNEYLYASYKGQWQKLTYAVSAGADIFFNTIEQAKDQYIRVKYSANVHYKFNRKHSLNIFSRGFTTMPNIAWLNPYNTSTDSLIIEKGNPELKPAYTYHIGINHMFTCNNWYIATAFNYLKQKNMPNTIGNMVDNIYTISYDNKKSQIFVAPSLTIRYNIPKWGYIGLYSFYQQIYWESCTNGAFSTSINWQLAYKNIKWRGAITILPQYYTEFDKIRRSNQYQTTVQWDIHSQWRIFANLDYIGQKYKYKIWRDDPLQDYHSYQERIFQDRFYQFSIGFQFSWKNKSKKRNFRKIQPEKIDVRLSPNEYF